MSDPKCSDDSNSLQIRRSCGGEGHLFSVPERPSYEDERSRENCNICGHQHAKKLGQLAYSCHIVSEQAATLALGVIHLLC